MWWNVLYKVLKNPTLLAKESIQSIFNEGGLLEVGDIQCFIPEAVADVCVEHTPIPVICHMTSVINSGNLKLKNSLFIANGQLLATIRKRIKCHTKQDGRDNAIIRIYCDLKIARC